MSYPNNDSFLRNGLAKVVATTLEANPLLYSILRNSENWVGTKAVQPIKYKKNGTFTMFTGLDLLPTNREETTVNMEFEMKTGSMAVALGGDELSQSQSDTSITDKLRFKLQEAEADLGQELGAVMYGNGTGSNFNGLGNIVDDGTNAATLGGLARATYPVLNSTVTASGGTLTLNTMVSVFNAISDSGIQPDMIVANRTVNALYEKIAQTLNQYLTLKPGQYAFNAGASSVAFKGIPVLIDPKATSQTLFMLNSKMLAFRRGMAVKEAGEEAIGGQINQMEGVPDGNMANLGFIWTGWKKPDNQSGIVGHILLRGNVIPKDPGRFGKITGITTS